MIQLRYVVLAIALLAFPATGQAYEFCGDRYCPQITAHAENEHSGYLGSHHSEKRTYKRHIKAEGVSFIPNPAGTWRKVASCAHRLAAYWGLGKGLDKVSTWPERFHRASGPGVGIAAVRNDKHHIIGIVGGGPGAWQVVDFNSTKGHGNREYTISSFSGYFFVDPRSKSAEEINYFSSL